MPIGRCCCWTGWKHKQAWCHGPFLLHVTDRCFLPVLGQLMFTVRVLAVDLARVFAVVAPPGVMVMGMIMLMGCIDNCQRSVALPTNVYDM